MMRALFQNRLLRYAVVGLVAMGAHYALMVACVEWAAWPEWLASGMGAVLGSQVAFVGNRHFTFQHSGPWWPSWLRFQGTAALGTVAGMLVVAVGVAVGVHYIGAQLVASALAPLLTFAVNRAWTFKPREDTTPAAAPRRLGPGPG
jgi:putative flippase GtrA